MRSRNLQRVLPVAAALLDYPDAAGDAQAAAALPRLAEVRRFRPLQQSCRDWLDTPLSERQTAHTAIFDFNTATTLNLTYASHGDTRDRGQALLAINADLASAGFSIASTELPDYLPLLCEFAAAHPDGVSCLARLTASLDLLSAALADHDGPFAELVTAVRRGLPRGPVVRLPEQPPTERVGT